MTVRVTFSALGMTVRVMPAELRSARGRGTFGAR